MRIGNLEMHCGECAVIEYCCEDGYAICADPRLQDTDTLVYAQYAVSAPICSIHECAGCNDDCTLCDHRQEALEYHAQQFSDYVVHKLANALVVVNSEVA